VRASARPRHARQPPPPLPPPHLETRCRRNRRGGRACAWPAWAAAAASRRRRLPPRARSPPCPSPRRAGGARGGPAGGAALGSAASALCAVPLVTPAPMAALAHLAGQGDWRAVLARVAPPPPASSPERRPQGGAEEAVAAAWRVAALIKTRQLDAAAAELERLGDLDALPGVGWWRWIGRGLYFILFYFIRSTRLTLFLPSRRPLCPAMDGGRPARPPRGRLGAGDGRAAGVVRGAARGSGGGGGGPPAPPRHPRQ